MHSCASISIAGQREDCYVSIWAIGKIPWRSLFASLEGEFAVLVVDCDATRRPQGNLTQRREDAKNQMTVTRCGSLPRRFSLRISLRLRTFA
jgi:hypothetical protein